MKTWTRAAVLTKCGGTCRGGDGYIKAGEPMLELRLVEMNVRKIRCVDCAGEQPPSDLPALLERSAIAPSPLVRDGVVKLPFDARLAQTGEREPGEDD